MSKNIFNRGTIILERSFKSSRFTNQKKYRTRIILIASIMIILSTAVVLTGVHIFDTQNMNPADTELQLIITSLTKAGGKVICRAGENVGGTNTIPWSTVYIVFSDKHILMTLNQVVLNQGFRLAQNTSYINQLQLDDAQPNGPLPDEERFNPNSTYLIGYSKDRELEVTVDRNGPLPLDCTQNNPGPYGYLQYTSGTSDIIKLSLIVINKT